MAKKSKPDTVSGVIVINKHEGVTSFRIISILKRMFDTPRVGHTGTLDPMATGVLPVLLGRAVKASDYVMSYEKRYVAEMKFGIVTDTEDITGEILESSDKLPCEDDVISAAKSFIGEIMQTPPMYSAIKIDGRKLVDIAREGGTVERKARPVVIYGIEIEKLSADTYRLDVTCSKGTYIRTLCADIGKVLGCGAVMSALTRVRTGNFTLDDAVSIEELEKMSFEERLKLPKPVETLFEEYPVLSLSQFHAKLFLDGAALYQKKIHSDFEDGQLIRVKHGDAFLGLGLAETGEDGIPKVRPEKLFMLTRPW